MRAASTPFGLRAIAALLALGVAVGAQATSAQDERAVSASLWSADRTFSCRPERVQMIVGGVGEGDDCAAGHASAARDVRESRVTAATQRLRDDDRRAILLQEMAHEQAALARLGSTAPSDETAQAVERTRSNLAALQRELSRTP
jgi:hypothetical protein